MASVETVTHYSHGNNIAQEEAHEVPEKRPPTEWPQNGAIEFKDIVMQYRPGLPFVLKGLSLSVHGGEKIGVVGRCVNWLLTVLGPSLSLVQNGSGKEFTDVGSLPYRGAYFWLHIHRWVRCGNTLSSYFS